MKTVNILRLFSIRFQIQKIKNKLTFKDILVNPDYAKELAELTGYETVPCLVTDDRPMKEGKDFRKYLVSHFM